jgi:ABC-type multidrug transport system fused ATPase/permease subunit
VLNLSLSFKNLGKILKNNLKPNWIYRVNSLGLSYKDIFILTLLSLVSTITEIFGMGMFLPIFQYMSLKGDVTALVEGSPSWQYIIDGFYYIDVEPSLLMLLIVSFVFFLNRQIFTYLRLVYSAVIRQRIIQIQRNNMFDKYIYANTTYHDSIPVGNLVNVVTTEVSAAVGGLMAPIGLIVYFIMLFAYIFILALLSWKITLLSVIVLFPASRVPDTWIKKSKHIGRRLVDSNTLMSEFLVARLKSPRLIRLAGTEVAEKKDFYKLTNTQRKHSVFSSILVSRTEVVMEPIVIGVSLIFLYISYTTLDLQVEIIGLYLMIALRLLPIIKGILSQWQKVQSSLGSIEIIENRLKIMQNSAEADLGVIPFFKLKNSISMSNIYYRYPTGEFDALKNIKIKIKSREVTALVGPSGSGKSTLIDLLPRLRSPSKGAIKIDGMDIQKYTLKTLRKAISYAPQSSQIFNGKVKDHILYGKIDGTEEEIREAARLAGAEDFINKLPDRFDTIIGEDAVKLSGGQKQRLDLARALIRKASILILDEPTSNLDAESEELFKQVLCKIRKETNTTIIIVTHRLASISDADNIIVLNQGIVEMTGTHSELLNQNGWYKKAWKMQKI